MDGLYYLDCYKNWSTCTVVLNAKKKLEKRKKNSADRKLKRRLRRGNNLNSASIYRAMPLKSMFDHPLSLLGLFSYFIRQSKMQKNVLGCPLAKLLHSKRVFQIWLKRTSPPPIYLSFLVKV